VPQQYYESGGHGAGRAAAAPGSGCGAAKGRWQPGAGAGSDQW